MMYDTLSSLRTYPSSFLEVFLPELMHCQWLWCWQSAPGAGASHVKFSNWTVLPWALCALAHPDYEEARAAAVYLCGSMWNLHTVQGDLAVQVQICWNKERSSQAWMVLQPAKYSFHTNQNCGVLKLCWAYPAGCRPPALMRTHRIKAFLKAFNSARPATKMMSLSNKPGMNFSRCIYNNTWYICHMHIYIYRCITIV